MSIVNAIALALEAIARIANISREAFVAKVDEALDGIREGKLIADEAFDQAQEDQERLINVLNRRKD